MRRIYLGWNAVFMLLVAFLLAAAYLYIAAMVLDRPTGWWVLEGAAVFAPMLVVASVAIDEFIDNVRDGDLDIAVFSAWLLASIAYATYATIVHLAG